MMLFFVDTNILLDLLAERKPFSIAAELLFQRQEEKKIKIYISAISFNNIYYIVNKLEGHKIAIKLLSQLSEIVHILPLDQVVLSSAFESTFKDFEDAIQYFSAFNLKNIEAIVTRNTKDFKNSAVPVLTPELALKLIGI